MMPSPRLCQKCGALVQPDQSCSKCLLTTGYGGDKESAAERIFQLALSQADEERAAFVKNATGGVQHLLTDVELLLEGYRKEGGDSADATLGDAKSSRMDLAAIQIEEPGTEIDHFRLVRLVGEGGMGTVWEAQQTGTVKRVVALKVIKLGMDTREVVARFERERQTLALMKHPGIAQVFEVGATQLGRPYFAMEFVSGKPITDYCDDVRMDIRGRLHIFADVCAAVQHAHQKGVIHRDLKPTNILVVDGQAKVIDFGVAKATRGDFSTGDSLHTQSSQILGTPAYMSPEQASGDNEDIDTRTDIYSLGALLYELLTGRTPFDAKHISQASAAELERILKVETPVRPSVRLKENNDSTRIPSSAVRGDLDWITMQCLAKDRKDRYSTANALGTDIGRHLCNEPVTAAAPSPLYFVLKWAARNRVAFVAGLAVALSLIGGTMVSIWQASIAGEEAENAKIARVNAERLLLSSRHEAGKVLLARALALENEKKHFQAKLTAGRAIDFAGFGRKSISAREQGAALLTPDSTEATKARRILNSRGNYALLWQSPSTAHHDGRITSVSYSPDGSRLASCSPNDNTVHFWNAGNGARLLQIKMQTSPWSVAYSPDGSILAVGGESSDIHLLNTSTGVIARTLRGSSGSIFRIYFSADGKQLGATDSSGTVLLWNLKTGESLPAIGDPGAALFDFAFSGDGNLVATVGNNEILRVWDGNSGQLRWEFSETSNDPFTVAFSHDSQTLYGGLGTGQIESWDLKTGSKNPRIFNDHAQAVYRLKLSPDGTMLASVSWDTRVRISQIDTGEEINLLEGHTTRVVDAAFHPSQNRMASVSNDNTVRIWDLGTSKELFPSAGHSKSVTCVTFSKDGQHLASAGNDRSVQIWNLKTGEPLKIVTEHIRDIVEIDYSPSGTFLASVSSYGIVKLWDTASGKRIRTPSIRHPGRNCSGLRFISESQIATTADDGSIRIWDLDSGNQLKLLQGHSSSVTSIDISLDGKLLASGGRDRTVLLWDLESGNRLATYSAHANAVSSVRFHPEGRILASGDQSGMLRFWDLRSGLLSNSMSACANEISAIDFSPNGHKLAVADADGLVCLFGMGTGKLEAILEGHNGGVSDVAFSQDGTIVATASSDRSVALWEAQGPDRAITNAHDQEILAMDWVGDILVSSDQQRIRRWDATYFQEQPVEQATPFAATCIATRPDNELQVYGTEEGKIILTRVADGKVMGRFLAHNDRVDSVRFSPSQSHLASVGQDGWIRIWNLDTANPQLVHAVKLGQPINSADSIPYSLAFSYDGSRLFCAGESNGDIRCWRTAEYTASLTLQGHTQKVRSLSSHPSQPIIASASADESIRLWNTTTLQQIAVLNGHSGEVYDVTFDPAGDQIASASEDQTVIVWNVHTRTSVEVLVGHVGIVRRVNFDASGTRLASADEDGPVRLWDLSVPDRNRYALDNENFVTSELKLMINRPAISDHLATNVQPPVMPIPASTQIGFLQKNEDGDPTRMLFWRCHQAGNWQAALHHWQALPETQREVEQRSLCRTLAREALSDSDSGEKMMAESLLHLIDEVSATDPDVITAKTILTLQHETTEEGIAAADSALKILPKNSREQRQALLKAKFSRHLSNQEMDQASQDLESLGSMVTADSNQFARYYNDYAEASFDQLSVQLQANDLTSPIGLRSLALIEYFRQASSIAPFDGTFLAQLLRVLSEWDATLNPALPLIELNSSWSFLDGGLAPGNNWNQLQSPSGDWRSGPAPLGFGSKIETSTKLRRNASNLREDPSWTTFHFRQRFPLPDLAARRRVLINCHYDDGIVVYLNGQEIGRRNMPQGQVTIDTPASVYQNEPGRHTYSLKSNRLHPHDNVIAAEIHQREPSSSDIYFALSLTAVGATPDTYLASIENLEIAESIDWLASFLPPALAEHWLPALRFALADSPDSLPPDWNPGLLWLTRGQLQEQRGLPSIANQALKEARNHSTDTQNIIAVGVQGNARQRLSRSEK
ncbi:MAG: WD40 repeat protein [Verrucomicrobiales bacterium]|jgi:WD40 repeat protein